MIPLGAGGEGGGGGLGGVAAPVAAKGDQEDQEKRKWIFTWSRGKLDVWLNPSVVQPLLGHLVAFSPAPSRRLGQVQIHVLATCQFWLESGLLALAVRVRAGTRLRREVLGLGSFQIRQVLGGGARRGLGLRLNFKQLGGLNSFLPLTVTVGAGHK